MPQSASDVHRKGRKATGRKPISQHERKPEKPHAMTIIYSVIIPAYNEEVWLAKSLPSLTAAMAIVRFPFRLLPFPRPHVFHAERGGQVLVLRHPHPVGHRFTVEGQQERLVPVGILDRAD